MKAIRMATMGALLAMAGATTAAAQVRVGVGVRTPSAGVRIMFGTPVYYSYAQVFAPSPYPVTYEEVFLEPWPTWPVGYWEYMRVYEPVLFVRYQRWLAFELDYRDAWYRHDWGRFRELRRVRWEYRNDLYRADRDFRDWQERREFRGRREVRWRDRDRDERGWRDHRNSGLWRDAVRDRRDRGRND